MMRLSALLVTVPGLAFAIVVLGLLGQPPSAEGADSQLYFPSHCNDSQVKPTSIILTCADGGLQVKDITWNTWNQQGASGEGTAWANDCTPNCAQGHFHEYPATV